VLEIRKGALKPIFEANPDLMSSVTEIIEERKALLNAKSESADGDEPYQKAGMVGAIRRFFGI
jgi:hypothetical protein